MSGFIDLHTHGIGRYSTDTSRPEDILKIAAIHGRAGTAAILPTIYSGPIREMRRNMDAVKEAMELQSSLPLPPDSARIIGAHLEGPFLNPARSGALSKRSFVKPTRTSLKQVLSDYEDIVKIITIAPEMPGALRVIEACSERGIRVNMGHSEATYTQALEGRKAGATGITHLFNAMRPFHHREPGLAGLGLLDDEIYIEVIADGIHLHPATLELIFNTKRLDRVILVSDSVKGRKKGKGAVYNEEGILSGSSITLADSVQVLKKIHIPDGEIIEATRDNPLRYISVFPR